MGSVNKWYICEYDSAAHITLPVFFIPCVVVQSVRGTDTLRMLLLAQLDMHNQTCNLSKSIRYIQISTYSYNSENAK